ncbi:MAG: 4-diphosphocytidyl-2C-methyl-D-erythritol kinase [Bacteroidetes bacterium]|jgi:4-diphosphocytidyl-2-C-methyl-D-erythritol kinase|nr:4-diphosphocytidyl-2C-methyl-D-erythritol kinase [Bacteroidota bacterium]
MITFPNAKINLGLNIVEKRSDGYHNLETIFYPVGWKDALEVVPADSVSLTISGIPIAGEAEKNLVMKAYRLLKKDYDLDNLNIYLRKNIPFGAGLGGGSADGAFMLSLLNRYFNLRLTEAELAVYAVRLGADCPFFIYNKPMFATGIGDILEPIEVNLGDYHIVIIKPDVAVPTVEAYSRVVPRQPAISLKTLIALPVEEWKGGVVNDFEVSVFTCHPELAELKELLYKNGAVYASMSGSGSALYGIFPPDLYPQFDIPNCVVWNRRQR